MTDEKDEERLINFDPAIASYLSEKGSSLSAEKPKKKDGRGKPGHAGAVGQDKTGYSKVTYRISKQRQELVREIAKEVGVHHKDIVEAAIVAFANTYYQLDEAERQANFDPYKEPASSLKAAFTLAIPDDFFWPPG